MNWFVCMVCICMHVCVCTCVCVCVCVCLLNKTGPCSASLPGFPNENSDFQWVAEEVWRKAQEHNVRVRVCVRAGANWKKERT